MPHEAEKRSRHAAPLILNCGAMWGGWSMPRFDRLLPGKCPSTPCTEIWVDTRTGLVRSGRGGVEFGSTGFRSRNVQPAASQNRPTFYQLKRKFWYVRLRGTKVSYFGGISPKIFCPSSGRSSDSRSFVKLSLPA